MGINMADSALEHVNITVSNAQKTAQLLCDLFSWNIRWQGPSALGGHTIHVGNQASYIAIYMTEKPEDYPGKTYKNTEALNHLGIVVADLDSVEQKVIDAGYKPCSHGDYEPGRRFYFFDHDNIEYEVVSYASAVNCKTRFWKEFSKIARNGMWRK